MSRWPIPVAAHYGYRDGERPEYATCWVCQAFVLRTDRLDMLLEHLGPCVEATVEADRALRRDPVAEGVVDAVTR